MQICNHLLISKKHTFLLFLFWLTIPYCGYSQGKVVSKNTTLTQDSIKSDTKNAASTTKQNSNQIESEINYNAGDSIVFLGNGTGFLHGKSDVKYNNITLKANYIRVKMDSSTVFARGTTDSTGTKIGDPVFNEGKSEYTSKELNYNLKTKKGFIRQAVTEQGEGYIISDRTKKTSDDMLCIAGGKYTTCDNHDHPDFYMSLTKGKVKPGSFVVAGPAYLVVQDVPLPIAVPFGFFPFTNQYSSGVLVPSYVDELTRGFGLVNGGYYFALNDFVDLELKGDVYTKGTWGLTANSTYLKKYKYRGNLSISYRADVTGEKDFSDYSKSTNLSIRWSHSQDTKANPYFNLSSSVNFSTSGYNRSNINSYYDGALNSENTKSSSVSFTQRFPESPFNISGSMLINQRTKDSTISLTLPNISVSMSRIYPFKRKEQVGSDRWYEKISMSYTGTMANSIDTKENLLLSSSLSKDWKNGIKHSIPVSATFNLLKYINISPSANYTERWYLNSIDKSWDKTNQEEVIDTINGFNRVYDFNVGVSASTKLYGFYIPSRKIFGDKVDRIRHVITPTVGMSYMPDFGESKWGYYDSYTKQTIDASQPTGFNNEVVSYSHYEGSLYGSPGSGKTGNVNFSVGNNVEMKLRNDKDTTGLEPFKIISLIDNFMVSSGYNLAADSMKWSTFSTNLRLKFGKSYSLSLSGSFDPYMYALNSSGNPVRVNKLRWNNGQFPRFLGTSTSYSYTLSNETFKKKKKKKEDTVEKAELQDQNLNDPNFPNQNKEQERNNELKDKAGFEKGSDGYEKVTIPWSISASYSIRYAPTSEFDYSKLDYKMGLTHNLSLSGNLDLTTKWRLNSSTSYDFDAKEFTYTNINIVRNLHCWTMSASVVPFGVYKSYNFKIGVNASMLSDLKYNKQSSYGTNNITWY